MLFFVSSVHVLFVSVYTIFMCGCIFACACVFVYVLACMFVNLWVYFVCVCVFVCLGWTDLFVKMFCLDLHICESFCLWLCYCLCCCVC